MTIANPESGEIVATLEGLEEIIERGLSTFFQVGDALSTIRDERMYRSEFATFEDYCRTRWGFSDSRARQLIAAAETVTTVTVAGGPAPTSERQARALNPLRDDPEAAADAMREAHEETGGKPTAEAVEQAVKRRTSERGTWCDIEGHGWHSGDCPGVEPLRAAPEAKQSGLRVGEVVTLIPASFRKETRPMTPAYAAAAFLDIKSVKKAAFLEHAPNVPADLRPAAEQVAREQAQLWTAFADAMNAPTRLRSA